MATNWYNYVLASAGTIFDEDTTQSKSAYNMDKATESICPKGWSLPSYTQIASVIGVASYMSDFSPTVGGFYSDQSLGNQGTHGHWWGSETTNDGAARIRISYNTSSPALYRNLVGRNRGVYIRCVQKS